MTACLPQSRSVCNGHQGNATVLQTLVDFALNIYGNSTGTLIQQGELRSETGVDWCCSCFLLLMLVVVLLVAGILLLSGNIKK